MTATLARNGVAFRFIANLEALLELLDETIPDDRLLKAEALCELGRFEDCVRLLESGFDEPLRCYADRIRQRALARDRTVFRQKRRLQP